MIQINFAALYSRLQAAAKADWSEVTQRGARFLARPIVAAYVAGEVALAHPRVQPSITRVRGAFQGLLERAKGLL